jgi:hypothetical protein
VIGEQDRDLLGRTHIEVRQQRLGWRLAGRGDVEADEDALAVSDLILVSARSWSFGIRSDLVKPAFELAFFLIHMETGIT